MVMKSPLILVAPSGDLLAPETLAVSFPSVPRDRPPA